MWRLGFFFHEMAFGLLSVFIPLYIVTMGGSLLEIGIMTSAALFLSIPASFFWGYICDRTRHYKAYILLSFASLSAFLYFFTLVRSVHVFMVLYIVMAVFHVAHEAPKNVLIAEHYPREEWEKSYSVYEAFTEVGWLIGLFTGSFSAALGIQPHLTLLLCSVLNLAAFVSSIFLVADPILIFERRLVGIEKTLDFTVRGLHVASKVLDGFGLNESVRKERFLAVGIALTLFSLATSMFFTPLPIFLSQKLALSSGIVFIVYMLNSGGTIAGYTLVALRGPLEKSKTAIRRVVLLRGSLIFLLALSLNLSVYPELVTALTLILLGFAYGVYHILALSLSMEMIPEGMTGLFDVLVGAGAASGSFIGPFIAQTMGYLSEFMLSGVFFFLAYVAIRFFS